jgi:hypothetical protein
VDALWPAEPPPAAERALAALLSRLRAAVGPEVLPVSTDIRLLLPGSAEIALEIAEISAHRAEVAVAAQDWATAWICSRIALNTARRGFLPDMQASTTAQPAGPPCCCRASTGPRTSSEPRALFEGILADLADLVDLVDRGGHDRLSTRGLVRHVRVRSHGTGRRRGRCGLGLHRPPARPPP